MKIKLAQLNVSHELGANKNKIITVLNSIEAGDWVLFPECMLTGYFPEEDLFLNELSPEEVTRSIGEIAALVGQKQCYCLLGTARYHDGAWYNSVAIISPDGTVDFYDKIALSDLDKNHFTVGDGLKVYTLGGVTFGVQICRELVFPEQWQELKRQGAQIIFHANNAIKPYDNVWEHIVIARAMEDQLFVASSNNCSEPAELTSYLVSPAGEVLLKAEQQQENLLATEIDLVNYKSPY